MPRGTPSIKVRNVSRLGAKVVLHGLDFDEAKAECARLASVHGLTFVPPYDDPLVIAGQGTVGMEILKQLNDSENLEAIFAAIGGGGLAAGICEYVKRIGGPLTKVIGAETFDGDAMARSLEKGERVTLTDVGPFSDGTAVKIVGEEPFRICQQLLDGVVKVDSDELCAGIKDIFEGKLYIINVVYPLTQKLLCRDTLSNRACWSPWSGRSQTLHHQQQTPRCPEKIRSSHQRRQHEL
jgi:threonine dehydratase